MPLMTGRQEVKELGGESKSDIMPSGRIETRGAVLIARELGFRSLGVQDAIFKGDEEHGIRERVSPDPAIE